MLLGRLLGLSRIGRTRSAPSSCSGPAGSAMPVRRRWGYSGGHAAYDSILLRASSFTPELLFLDEPTTRLDPRSRNQVWSLIRSLAEQGTTVLLTTQYLDEAGQLAGKISVIDRGKVIAEGGVPDELRASIGAGAVHVRLREPAQRDLAERLLSSALGVPISRDADPASRGTFLHPRRVESALTLL